MRNDQYSSYFRFFGPLQAILLFVFFSLLVFTISRLGLSLWEWPRLSAVNDGWKVMLYGLRMDIVLLSWISILPVFIALLLPNYPKIQRIWSTILVVWITFWLTTFVFMEVVTPAYIAQYDQRPARIFIEYLVYPREVFSTIWVRYKLELIVSLIATIGTAIFVACWSSRVTKDISLWSWRKRLILLPFIILLLLIGARSSFSHRPANPSTVAFSSDHLVNDLALNSTYSLLYAIDSMRDEKNAASIYGDMSREEIIRRVLGKSGIPLTQFIHSNIPSLHSQLSTHHRDRLPNLVIILEESMGAQFVNSLGGLPLTPELDKLSKKGWWFTRLYATGTRSVRGIEAVITGFLPTPARSVVKLGLSQTGFYTIAKTLHKKGYSTEFIYGGEGHFDNMANFFLSNGFDSIYDEKNYSHPIFRGSWGVSDEDLFAKAHQIFMKKKDKPFFALIFSTSSHTPYEFPDGRIQLYEQPKDTAYNAMKYADYALGKFVRRARRSPYWDNTIFLIIADHDSRVFGASLVPIEHFHIPALILGKYIPAKSFTAITSQIDMAPTLLSLMGINAEHPMIGQDLTKVPQRYEGRAIMQYGDDHAYMQGDHVVIHAPQAEPQQFIYRNKQLIPENLDPELAKDALAHVLWPSMAYRERSYRD